ncbi:capsule polysaccharide biosynthesis [Apiospora rasikravindrae]|uniref:Capsule polysaccharide biosynthesis n=1 Tax=Apiospora rasikravindrae TaxID=990691 RepID=A0ABR1S2Q7_9PEZI
MASSFGFMKPLSKIAKPVLLPAATASLAYGTYHGRQAVVDYLVRFLTGPGRTSRLIAVVLVLINWKSLPLAWTVRVWNTMIQHIFVRKLHTHTPDKLFHPAISSTHVSLMEVDYNLHKSNSTYFADLDVSRSHLASHLFARGCRLLADNEHTRLVMDPKNPDKVAKGRFGVMLGAVACNFKREIRPFAGYEMWTRVLSWDRKWLYMVTHFVEKGAVRPRSWAAEDFGLTADSDGKHAEQEWEKKVYASAVSKYVFKIGRLTVHPAVIIGASGLLPERPDGWVSPAGSGMVTPAEPVVGNTDGEARAEEQASGWDWVKTETERAKGHAYAEHFAQLEDLHGAFCGGGQGALGHFSLG